MTTRLLAVALLGTVAGPVRADYPGWKHSGSVFVLTTPEGANLPAAASVEGFPLLVRLDKDFFDFSQAKPNGADLRFASARGEPLPYQIEEWDAAKGTASVWVRVPKIQGNARQEIRLHWGKADAEPESNGKAVFNESNGYLSVWHMTGPVSDAAGTLESKDAGTTPVAGVVGPARRLAGKQGVFCGDKITSYPTGAEPHSSEAWFRAERPNATVIGWGNQAGQGKVVMQYRSPPHVSMDCFFSGANVTGKSRLPAAEWVHVVHTYEKGNSRVYVNGALDGASTTASGPLNIKSPARLWIGGWYNNYDFVGDLDEVRVSKVARSADWVRLQYENQKPMQTVVGPVVQAGTAFSVSDAKVSVEEGKSVTLTARAGGAQKLYWVVTRDGRETVAAVDRFSFTFDAGRVVGNQSLGVQLKAVYPDEVKTTAVAVTITEAIPEPVFTLAAPATWDGRSTIEVVPQVSNLNAMREKGADKLNYTWKVTDLATIHEAVPGKLVLKRAQNSGTLTVAVAIDNGGTPTTQFVSLAVTEPAKDAWVARTPAKDEKPVANQFYARDDTNEGTLHYNGTLAEAADAVFLKLYADDKLVGTTDQKPAADKSFALSAKLKPGLITYKVEFGTRTDGRETVLDTVGNLVCGDAYVITGQSNAVATDFGKDDPAFRSEWVRTFGGMSGSPKQEGGWGNAVHRSRDAGKLQVGYWGMELARRLVESHKVPICLINGAVGGTRIDQHQRNAADPEDGTTIYGRLLWRVRQAKLTHGIRGVLWHQGENDQGADGPTGGYGWETYRQLFIEMAAGWKQDFPNVRHYYVFQIWPRSCAMGINGSDNRLREVQRTLPTAFSNMSIMSTLGIDPPGGCHFPAAGYAEFARLICPLVERDHYGKVPTASVTPPNLKRAYFATDKKDEVVLEFDQPVKWTDALASQFYLDGEKGKVASGSVLGSDVRLKLAAGSTGGKITYLDSAAWSQANLLRGENGIAALTFCEVPVLPRKP
ncbi:Uncharacterized protein OS=Pirellula staleyi (strain ATCC 27377 / DSM 6068 / ICPB 4128) GN=Psta_4257 PE=4 SV=1: DUF2341: Laminin_G_3: DUF303 [Gemmataceae bacterium]|nr:Uncharacterized protein OS=Pirellula staleyi (strain ATCC 27377 / DSM 6068 / ICPB 4128) GN=Psta_4257 PE=4 SV=1: DUF2341: Laminin_G_3: DUF303 [Gemmataceae bacterium]VTT97620.1 Uncharacterized protein OS=Pirellula staleyi (strain ATCC 27377 / DSM 6068 / ICPB 4128) GN=Psta_4257 PE=4 SV=1: DUF2341: Laminin_G_3: DUF303 [Gemmataceae bacterium]